MTAFSFSYSPKASSALASINPIQSRGEGLRFTANTPMSFIKQNPEIVTEGFWKGRQALTEGIVKGVTSALSGVSGALTAKAAETKADTKLTKDRAHEMAIAKIKAAPTEAETAYQQQRSDLLKEQIDAAKAKNKADEADDGYDAIPSGGRDWRSYNRPNFNQTEDAMTDSAGNVIKPADPASTGTPAGTTYIPNPQTPAQNTIIALQKSQQEAENAKKQLTQSAATSVKFETEKALQENNFDELDRLANLGAIDQNLLVQYKSFANSAKRSSDRLAKLQAPDTNTLVAENTPVSTPESAPDRTIFGQSNNPNFVPLRDALKNRGVVSEMPTQFSEQSVAPSENLSFLDINSITPEQTQSIREGYQLPVVESSSPKLEMPEVKEQLVLNGVSLPLAQVTGAEGKKPLAAVEPVLPTAVPSEPAQPVIAQAVPETEAEYRYRLESDLTGQPFMNPADARMAKNILEQQLGVKAVVNGIDAGKGKRIYRVEIVEDAPPKTPPEGFFTKKITDAGGKETYVYEPKIPVKQQIITFDKNIEKAKILQETLTKIEKIAPGYLFAGAGGASGLMKYNPFANDAKTTRALLDTVKGIVGFDELVALKAQGGTLGALSDKELDMLTSLKGSINPDMDEATFLENIKKMNESTKKLIAGLEADKKEVMNVESPTKFQNIQSKKPKDEKDKVYIINGSRYKWDGNEYKLIQ